MPPRPLTPLRLLLDLASPRRRDIALGLLLFACAGCCSIPQLWTIGRIVDEGFIGRSVRDLVFWLAITAVLVVAQPLFWSTAFRRFAKAEAAGQEAVVRRLTDRLNEAGPAVRARIPPGELLNLPSEDTRRSVRVLVDCGFLFNNLVLFIAGSVLAWSIHPLLGAVIVGGSFVTAFIAGPLLGRLQQRQSDYRAQIGELTAHASDIVGGLRVLRGIGGDLLFAERYREHSDALRRKGYEVAGPSSWIHALRHSMPILFVAVITWVGAILTAHGAISIGELTSAFSVATVFIAVSGNFIGSAHYLVVGWVATKRLVRAINIEADIADQGTARADGGELRDPDSGLTVPVGALTIVVTGETAPVGEACERLARFRDSEAVWGGRPIEEYALAEVRGRIMLLTDEDHLFAGTLAEALRVPEAEALQAIWTASAEDAAANGLATAIDEGGRNLSGGQRQRLRLARALAAEPETLLAVEPTSAVDAHTESLIAARVAEARAGRTTLVVTTSPLWLAHADGVVWMVDGKVHAAGGHADLLGDPAYRRLASHSLD